VREHPLNTTSWPTLSQSIETSVVCKGGSHPGDASLNTPGFS
jgi:hypothetical protein